MKCIKKIIVRQKATHFPKCTIVSILFLLNLPTLTSHCAWNIVSIVVKCPTQPNWSGIQKKKKKEIN